jgi:hypothetical protein
MGNVVVGISLSLKCLLLRLCEILMLVFRLYIYYYYYYYYYSTRAYHGMLTVVSLDLLWDLDVFWEFASLGDHDWQIVV